MRKYLVLIPTYNEIDNVITLVRQIFAQNLSNLDILFIDDNSPDGTGKLIEKMANNDEHIYLIERKKKMGIGNAHLEGIKWAYKNDYKYLITMDADFTHSPSDIPRLIGKLSKADVVITTRYRREDSLSDWNYYRKLLTKLGHLLTKVFLGMEYDATGAFRLYNLSNLPPKIFELIKSDGYSFFFESL